MCALCVMGASQPNDGDAVCSGRCTAALTNVLEVYGCCMGHHCAQEVPSEWLQWHGLNCLCIYCLWSYQLLLQLSPPKHMHISCQCLLSACWVVPSLHQSLLTVQEYASMAM